MWDFCGIHFRNKEKSLENQGFFDFWKSYRVLIENPSGGSPAH